MSEHTAALLHNAEMLLSLGVETTLGWWPLPDGSCACPARDECSNVGKHSIGRWPPPGSVTAAQLRSKVGAYPQANLIALTGERSRLVVIDVDRRAGGYGGLFELVFGHVEDWPGNGVFAPDGQHFWFRHDYARTVQNSAGRLARGVDVRGHGGAALVPPSRRPGGRCYRWAHGSGPGPLPELPGWLLDRLCPPPLSRAWRWRPAHRPRKHGSGYVMAALRGEVAAVAATPEGARNQRLNQAAWNLGRFVASGQLDAEQVGDELLGAALGAGLEFAASVATIRSGMNARLRKVES